MGRSSAGARVPAILVAYAAVALGGLAPARAVILSNTPDALPLLGDPYVTPGAGCFVLANLCVEGGEFTLTSLVPGGFNQSGSNEFITTNATYTGDLVNFPSMTPAGTVTLTGTIEQEVMGRPNPFDTGSWTAILVSMSLSGSLGGFPLSLTLNPAETSSGTTTIAQDGGAFAVTSFFDVFAEITLDTPNPLQATPPGIMASAIPAPEPATLALLAGPMLAVPALRRRQR